MSAVNLNCNYNSEQLNISQEETSRYLDWTKRPEIIKEKISTAFNRLAKNTSSRWGVYNGCEVYCVCDIDEHTLMKTIIQQAPANQKNFYVLDIGAGNFAWGNSLAEFIENQADFPQDSKVHIIGVRGESYFQDKIIETDRCIIYPLGAFKVEELFEEFKKRGLDLENKIDLAVSHFCFRHLVDPVGTFAQTYNLLRPETGFLCIDGFFFTHEEDNMDSDEFSPNHRMTQLFLDTKASFLTRDFKCVRSLNQFVLQRPDTTPCQLPMEYVGVEVEDNIQKHQIRSNCITRFKREPQELDKEEISLPSNDSVLAMSGTKKLYDYMKQNKLFVNGNSRWEPIHDKDRHQKWPPLHTAVLQKNIDKVIELLDAGCDLNEYDSDGSTALHLAIRKNSAELFQLLLEKGAHLELKNVYGYTPLHQAVLFDDDGRFINALINAGANINGDSLYNNPLQTAINKKNLKTIELLIKSGAEISKRARKMLEAKSAFSSLKDLLKDVNLS
ncbi:MAG: ankyrin repeat domain-containing protein [Chlamydiota bacterium]